MISLNARRDEIRDRLTDFLSENLRLTVHDVKPPEWVAVDSPTRIYGYTFPVKTGETMEIAFCPDVIAAHTALLGDENLDLYLDIVEYLISQHIVFYDDYPDPMDRAHKAEDELFRLKPDAMQFLSQIQMAALDMLADDDEDD